MMIGGAVWFVLGLTIGTFFFYGPVLFVLGFVTFTKGLVGLRE